MKAEDAPRARLDLADKVGHLGTHIPDTPVDLSGAELASLRGKLGGSGLRPTMGDLKTRLTAPVLASLTPAELSHLDHRVNLAVKTQSDAITQAEKKTAEAREALKKPAGTGLAGAQKFLAAAQAFRDAKQAERAARQRWQSITNRPRLADDPEIAQAERLVTQADLMVKAEKKGLKHSARLARVEAEDTRAKLMGTPPVTVPEVEEDPPPRPKPPCPEKVAHLQVFVPDGTELWLDDYRTKTSGTERWFSTPPLPTCKTYYYRLKAYVPGWDPRFGRILILRTATVWLRGGETSWVKFY